HPAKRLGRDHHLVARDPEILETLSEDRLGSAFGIDVCGVDEIYAGIQRALQDRVRLVLLDLADRLPHPAAAEGHGAETEFGNVEAGPAERVVAHGTSSESQDTLLLTHPRGRGHSNSDTHYGWLLSHLEY